MKFLGFSKIWRRFLENNFLQKKKKILGEIFLREISFQILEKIQDFIFIFPCVLAGCFFIFSKVFSFSPKVFSIFNKVSVFIKKSIFLSD